MPQYPSQMTPSTWLANYEQYQTQKQCQISGHLKRRSLTYYPMAKVTKLISHTILVDKDLYLALDLQNNLFLMIYSFNPSKEAMYVTADDQPIIWLISYIYSDVVGFNKHCFPQRQLQKCDQLSTIRESLRDPYFQRGNEVELSFIWTFHLNKMFDLSIGFLSTN